MTHIRDKNESLNEFWDNLLAEETRPDFIADALNFEHLRQNEEIIELLKELNQNLKTVT